MVMQINKESSHVCGSCRKAKKFKHEFKKFQFSSDSSNKQDSNISNEAINLFKNHDSYLPNESTFDERQWKTASLPNNISRRSIELNDTTLSFSSTDDLNFLKNKDTQHTSSKLFKYNFPTYDCQETLDSYVTKCNDTLNNHNELPSNSNYGVLFNTSADLSRSYFNRDSSICEHGESDCSTISSNSTPRRSPLYNNFTRCLNSNKEIEVYSILNNKTYLFYYNP